MTRDWYTLGQLAFFPMLATMLLHGLLLAMLILRWQGDAQSRTIEASVLPPAAINATLIDASSLKAKKEPAKRSPPPKRETPVKPNPKPVAKTPIVPSKPVVKADPKPAEKLPEARRLSADELAAISRSEMADALAAEDAMTVAVTAEEMAASYAALIRDTVSGYWRRPPSARNGM
ncbi:MAG: protein TolA, partial [Pseudomonadota bacterium]